MPPKGRKAQAAQKKKKPQPQRQVVIRDPKVQFSKCAREFAATAADPFRPSSACLPFPPSVDSLKLSTFIRGTFHTGGSNSSYGFVTLDPENMIASDADAIFNSTSSFTGTTIAGSGTGIIQSSSNSTFVTADIGADVQFRIVAAGLRIRYAGTELDRGGRVVGLVEPDHRTLTAHSFSELLEYAESSTFRPDGEWHCISMVPRNEVEGSYENSIASTVANMAFMVVQPGTTSLAFEYECWTHFEVIGPVVRGQTPSHVDVIGASAVQGVVSQNYGSWVRNAWNYGRLIARAANHVLGTTGMTTFPPPNMYQPKIEL